MSDAVAPRGDVAFVGRATELAAVGACAEAAAAGQSWVVWIEGEAGSGKTALVRRIVADLPDGFVVERVQADELATDIPFALLRELRLDPPDDPFGAGLDLVALLARRQDDGPVALVVEDLHWADAASRQALLVAAHRLGDDRVLLVVTSRPDPGAADGWEQLTLDPEGSRRVALGALAWPEVARLADALGVPLDRPAAERLHRHTQGHPLYVRTLLAELTPEQLTAPDGELPAPRSLASTTIARIAALDPEPRALVAALAVLNQPTPLAVLARVAGVDRPTEAIEQLLATGFVVWPPSGDQPPVRFTHPLHRIAVYDDLSPTRRQELHRSAAEHGPRAAVLDHRLAAADVVDDQLAADLVAAAEADIGSGALARAARYLTAAASLSGDRDATEDRLAHAVRVLLEANQVPAAQALADQLEAGADRPARNLALGHLARHLGRAEDAERLLRSVADDPGDPALAAKAQVQLSILFSNQGRADDLAAAAEAALASGRLEPADERATWIGLAMAEGMRSGAAAGLERFAERLPPDPADVATADSELLVTRGGMAYYGGRLTEAAADLREATSRAQHGVAMRQRTRAHLHLAQVLLYQGDWDESLVHARLSLDLAHDEHEVWTESQAEAVLGTVLASRGDWDAAARHIAAADELATNLGHVEAWFTARMAEAALARARVEPAGVVAALAPLVGSGESDDIVMYTSLGWWPTLLTATVELGDLDAADHGIDQLEHAAEVRRLDLTARIAALRGRSAAARGSADEAITALRSAVEHATDDDPVIDQLLVHLDLGRVLRARGDRRAAIDQLRVADELVRRLGATPYRERIEADLDALGIRTEESSARSPFALTDRERDVVALVAKGHTNRETAAQLYVSEKAIEYHLGNVFSKLGISSRRQLRDLDLSTLGS